jgi:hypothetical protein
MKQHRNNPDLFKYYFKNVIDKRAKKLLEDVDQTSYRQFVEFKKQKAVRKQIKLHIDLDEIEFREN